MSCRVVEGAELAVQVQGWSMTHTLRDWILPSTWQNQGYRVVLSELNASMRRVLLQLGTLPVVGKAIGRRGWAWNEALLTPVKTVPTDSAGVTVTTCCWAIEKRQSLNDQKMSNVLMSTR